jgi:uncharacterized protein (TIGR02217 family)
MPAPAFDAAQFPPDVSRGAQFGPTFSTIVVETVSGGEVRISQWPVCRHRGTISLEARTPAQFAQLKAFFLARSGRARAFRFKDWSDFSVTNEPLVPLPANSLPTNPPAGAPTVQLVKSYNDGLINYVRNIYAPVVSPAVTLRKNGGAFGGFSLDTTTGLASLTLLNSKAITNITQAASAVVTVGAANGFAVNDLVYFSNVFGMTQINGLVGQVTAAPGTTITVNINSTAFSAYTSGGTAAKYLVSTDTLDWTGQFDTPVRLDTDELQGVQEDVAILSWSSIGIVELVA